MTSHVNKQKNNYNYKTDIQYMYMYKVNLHYSCCHWKKSAESHWDMHEHTCLWTGTLLASFSGNNCIYALYRVDYKSWTVFFFFFKMLIQEWKIIAFSLILVIQWSMTFNFFYRQKRHQVCITKNLRKFPPY